MRVLHGSLPTCTAVGLVGAGLQGTAPAPQDLQSLAPALGRFDAAPELQQPPRVAAQSRLESAHILSGEWSSQQLLQDARAAAASSSAECQVRSG